MSHSVFVDDFSPYLFQWHWLGHTLGVRWYGLAYVFGFLLTFLFFRSAARYGTILGFGTKALEYLTTAVPLGVVLGGRLGFVVQHSHELVSDPLFLFRIWQGGMAFFGGLTGVLLALRLTARRFRVPFLTLTDLAVFPAALGLAFGRIANFFNGELVGRPTHGGWGVVFPQVDRVPRYPSQLYESASHFLLFGILIFTSRFCRAWTAARSGRLSALFLALYGFFRFLTDFYRADDTYWGLLSDGQWISLLTGLFGLAALGWLSRAKFLPKNIQQGTEKRQSERESR